MIETEVIIVDYGVGTILSVQRAVESCGSKATVSSDPNVIKNANRVILPGVGAFANGMKALKSKGLIDVLLRFAESETPLLGICLGMQLLFDESEEFGVTKGLCLIQGRVVPLSPLGLDGTQIKIPNIGWRSLEFTADLNGEYKILKGLKPSESVYFVHSFKAVLAESGVQIAECTYGENKIPAIVRKGNIIGCQFHPEKSGEVGLKIIKNFIEM
jgi:glutamine amidotransferase